jgi:hypothetical protein
LTIALLRLYHRCHDLRSNFESVESAVVPELLAIARRIKDYENVFAWSFATRKVFDPGALYSA